MALFWAPILLLLSLVTYPLEKNIFNFWLKFSLPWIVLSSLAVFFTPTQQNFGDPNWKAVVSLSFTAIFFIVSLLIIFIKSLQIYWYKK